MKASELRQKYLDFFKAKGHAIIPSASLIPENDPTVLFTTAGMHPLVPYLMGEKHPEGNRLTNVQKCVRTGDIDEVGDATHHTFFEMLGNWSLGDYFKEDAIKMSWEFLTSPEWLGLNKNRLAISIFAGDQDAPKDEEAKKIWLDRGVPKERIAELGKEDNWWGPAGETGPCGPDTEMFYWTGENEAPKKFNPKDNPPAGGWVEIWNDVFMQYNKTKEGKFEPLKQKNVDTGMGLERTLAVINGLDDNYRTELFWPIIEKIEELSGEKYYTKNNSSPLPRGRSGGGRAMRIIADHIKAATMILGDDRGVAPSNTGAGYVLRRLIRRAVRYAKQLGVNQNFTGELAKVIVKIYQDVYPEVKKNEKFIFDELEKEEKKFKKTLEIGLKVFNKILDAFVTKSEINIYGTKKVLSKKNIRVLLGYDVFNLYQSYGFPLELVKEIAREKGVIVDEVGFCEELKKHQDLSRTASAGMFKGGLADASEETKKLHTTAHLMLEALRRVLGEHVQQKGSNITAERLRFDFSHADKMTDEQIKEVENIVNEQIEKDLPVAVKEMTVADAKKMGATGVFASKYGEKVKVYSVGNFSREICGGPHVERTGKLGKFKIKKEQSSSAGVRRIKAVLE